MVRSCQMALAVSFAHLTTRNKLAGRALKVTEYRSLDTEASTGRGWPSGVVPYKGQQRPHRYLPPLFNAPDERFYPYKQANLAAVVEEANTKAATTLCRELQLPPPAVGGRWRTALPSALGLWPEGPAARL